MDCCCYTLYIILKGKFTKPLLENPIHDFQEEIGLNYLFSRIGKTSSTKKPEKKLSGGTYMHEVFPFVCTKHL